MFEEEGGAEGEAPNYENVVRMNDNRESYHTVGSGRVSCALMCSLSSATPHYHQASCLLRLAG